MLRHWSVLGVLIGGFSLGCGAGVEDGGPVSEVETAPCVEEGCTDSTPEERGSVAHPESALETGLVEDASGPDEARSGLPSGGSDAADEGANRAGAVHAVPMFRLDVERVGEDGPLSMELEPAAQAKFGLGACELLDRIGGPADLQNPDYVGVAAGFRPNSLGGGVDCGVTPEESEFYQTRHAVCNRLYYRNTTAVSYLGMVTVVTGVGGSASSRFLGMARSDPPPLTLTLEDGSVIPQDPWSELGIYGHGPLGAVDDPDGNEADADIVFLFSQRVGGFTLQADVWFLVQEQCGTGEDNNCDGLADSGCGLFEEGEPCLRDEDCVLELRCGGVTAETFGECVLP